MGVGKVTAGLTSQQMLWPPADNHRRAGGQEAILVQSSQIRDANRARLSFLAGHQSLSPTRERVFREPVPVCIWSRGTVTAVLPQHPPSTLLDTGGVSSVPRAQLQAPRGRWGYSWGRAGPRGEEPRVGGACPHSSSCATPGRAGHPPGRGSHGRLPQTVWLLQPGAGCYWSLV